jgi:hypothetical protein
MNSRDCLAVIVGAALIAGSGICGGKDPRALLISVFQTDDVEVARGLLANTPAVVSVDYGYNATATTYITDSVR